MKTPLTHALRDGRLISIHQVPSGLACACVCPACLRPLMARKGRKMTHHFAHQRGEECPFGVETMVHQLAKKILAAEKQIMLPAVRVGALPAAIFPAQPFGFEHVWLEHRLHDIVPDLYVQQGRRRLLIEIACTHPCPPAKKKRIAGLGIAAMEVDLSGLVARLEKNGQPLEEEDLRKALILAPENRRWLFNPKKNALELALQRRSDRRKVKRIGRGKKTTLCVYPCPERKRRWKTGPLKGQSYAQVYRDCLHCPYCLRIDYREELRAYQWAPVEPERVFCWAREKEWMGQFVYPEGENGGA
jgi:hypothetical protein